MGRISVQGVFRWLRQACEDPGNMDAREGMALAAYNAGVAINQVNVGNVHAIAHRFGQILVSHWARKRDCPTAR